MRVTWLLIFLTLNCCFACTMHGQSSFILRNHTGASVDAPVFNADGIPLAGADYRAELWGSATSDSLTPLMIISQGSGREIVPFGVGGYFSSGSAFLCVLTVPPGGFAWLQVRAWDARLGGTYEAVAGLGIGGYGESSLFYAQGRDPFREPPEAPGPLIGLQSFSLRPVVPEPSTWALLALGGTTFWWTVRRQRQKLHTNKTPE